MRTRLITFNNWSSGMFSMVKAVLCALASCEADGVAPTVVVGNSPFREDGYTGNVWTRFFNPIDDESLHHDESVVIASHPCLPNNDCYFHNRERMNAIVSKWVVPNAVVQSRIDSWLPLVHSTSQRLGVHFRGSDKHIECTHVPPSKYLAALKVLRGVSTEGWLLCTDCSTAADELSHEPGMILTDSERVPELRGGYGVHFRAKDRGKAGSDAVLDAWLLAACRILICGPSNLSEFVTFLNPAIVHVSMR